MINSFFAFLYIVLVVLIMNNGSKLFGDDNSIFAPIGILLLLVLSVSIMGMLIFGKAILMYLEGEKKDAVRLTVYTITSLFVITFVYFLILIFI